MPTTRSSSYTGIIHGNGTVQAEVSQAYPPYSLTTKPWEVSVDQEADEIAFGNAVLEQGRYPDGTRLSIDDRVWIAAVIKATLLTYENPGGMA